MILREKVTIGFDGGRDEDGGWIPPRNANYLAEVEAVSAEESAALGREPSSLTYKVLLPRMRTGDTLTASSTITWRGITFQVVGQPMLHTVAGRLHHIEVTMSNNTG